MDWLKQYIISVVAAALICSMISCLFEEGAGNTVLQMLCGFVLTIAILSPLRNVDFSMPKQWGNTISEAGEKAVSTGVELAQDAKNAIIKQQAEAYILDKATQWNADITVEVIVEDGDTITKVIIGGILSPYAKVSLEEMLVSDMGVPKENQVWTG